MIYRSCIIFWCMFPINEPNETTMKGYGVIHDLLVSHWPAGPCGTLPRKSSRCMVSADSQRRDAIVTEEILHLDFLHHPSTLMSQRRPKQHEPTVSSLYQAKITVTAIDINIFPSEAPQSSPPPMSFIRVFIFFLGLSASLCKGCLCLRRSDRTAQLSVKCWDPGSWPAL